MAIRIERCSVGFLETNCYIVWNPEFCHGLIIDPGDEAETVLNRLNKYGVRPGAIALTHAHVDHICAVPALTSQLGVPVYVPPAERSLYRSPDNAIPPFLPAADGLPEPVDALPEVPGLACEVLDTPGHTPGGVSYYFPDERVVFTGDALFAGSLGRTDLPGGSLSRLLDSIREVLFALPDETRVYPGHGGATDIGLEKRTNPCNSL